MKTAIPLHIDPADLARLKEFVPDLSEIELPNLQTIGRTADNTIDRLLGRSRTPVWQWVVTGIGLIALMGAIAAAFMWMRRPLGLIDQAKNKMANVEPATTEPVDAPVGDTAFDELDSALAGVAEA